MVVCEDVAPDPENPNRLTLFRVVHSIRVKVGVSYPVTYPQLCAFAQLTEGRGAGRMRVEVRAADSDGLVYRTPPVEVRFRDNDPLMVHGVTFRVRGVRFPNPGLYWFQLWFDDAVLIQSPVLLR
jgi:hypothetical protein